MSRGCPITAGKGGYQGGEAHVITDEEGEAERAAMAEWRDEHLVFIEDSAIPAALAKHIRDVGEQLDALIQADKPMAAIRLSEGNFARQARDAALRASYLDHSWSQIGEALGISKQAAWERYGKVRPEAGR
jgi:hypothetical protein